MSVSYQLRGQKKAVRVLYLDIDGTVRKSVNELGRFVNCAADVDIFEEVPKLLTRYKDEGWRIVGVSNQGGVALGHLTFDDMIDAMQATYDQSGQQFDRMMMCSHHPQASDQEMAVCWCRKPRIGLLVEAGISLGEQHRNEFYPPHLAMFVGDRPEDEECARNAGIAFKWAKDWRREALE